MTEQGQQDSTIRTLSSQLHDGILDPAAAAQLRSLLDKFPAGQDAYIDSVALHVLLVGAHEPALQSPSASELKALLPTSMPTGSVVSPGFDPNAGSVQTLHPGEQEHAPSGRRGSGTQAVPMKIGFVAAAAALLLTTGLWWNRSVSTTSEPFVAVLTDTAGVVWFADPPGAAPTRLESGRRIQLAEGLAELTFTSGAVVVVKGPADLELLSPMRVRAKRGAVRARVGSDAAGFVIETPTANVLDLGTEFGVDVNESGATDVVVFDGEVVLSYESNAPSQATKGRSGSSSSGRRVRLAGGHAMHVGVEGRISRIVAINSEQFPKRAAMPQATRKPVIAAVHDNIPSPEGSQYYEIVHGDFREDARVYVDRQHQYNGVDESGLPSFLLGCDYVMTFNSDKWQPELEITVQLAQPAELYILYDKRLPIPEWLSSQFVDTGEDVGIDEYIYKRQYAEALAVGPGQSIDTIHSVWVRTVERPGSVRLGAIGKHELTVSMYGIAARPLDAEERSPALAINQDLLASRDTRSFGTSGRLVAVAREARSGTR